MPPRKWLGLLPLLPPSLLFLVALGQVYLAHTADLTPWKGGGFGMFSTNDGESRRVEVWVIGPQGERQIEVPSYDRGAMALAAFPTVERLNEFGRRVGESERSRGLEVERVRVAVWRPDFQVQTMERRREPIRESVVVLEQSSRVR
jgi:hypothetical protein